MKRLIQVGCGALVAAVLLGVAPVATQAQQRLAVEEGPLTAQHPFGICPVTEKARTPNDFYLLFGYLPASSGVSYPGVPTTPPKSWPKTYWTPKPHQLESMKHDPLSPYKPQAGVAGPTKPNTIPPKNTAPPKNTIPPSNSVAPSKPAPVQPPKNASPAQLVKQLTSADVNEMKRQLGAQQTKLIDEIGQRVNNAPDPQRRAALEETVKRVSGHVNSGGVTGRDIADLVGGIKSALPAADQKPALDAAGQMAANQQVQQWLAGNGGTNPGAAVAGNNPAGGNPPAVPNTGGRLGAGNAAGGAAGPNPPAVPNTGGRLGASNVVGGPGPGIMNDAARRAAGSGIANPGMGRGPLGTGNAVGGPGRQGNNVPIGLIPGLPAGLIIPLPFAQGGGAALVGMGQPGNRILLGTGDPDQAAGLLVAPPDAPPAMDATGAPSVGDTVLSNAAAGPVRYVVNQSTFSMQPQEEQTLPAGTNWIVEFDRGNGRGSARYQLEQGYYEFRSAADGWELYRKQFTTTLDNVGGLTTFNYVAGNRTQTLGAGEKHDLAGNYPPVVRFDDSAGEVKERRLTADHYRVALGTDRTFDLFSADSVPLPAQRAPSSSGTPSTAPASSDSARSEPSATSLPPGFKLFDTTAAVTDRAAAARVPPSFDLFQEFATWQ